MADNTVVVLKTKAKKAGGAEYRVTCLGAAENLFYEADYPSMDKPCLNREWTLRIFKGAQVFTDEAAAFKEAARIEKEAGYVEYGIRLHDLSTIFFPATDRKRSQRRFVRTKWQTQPTVSRW